MRRERITIGVLSCAALPALVWYALEHAEAGKTGRLMRDLWHYSTGTQRSAIVEFPERVDLAVGDPIFTIDAQRQFRQVGEVWSLEAEGQWLAERRGDVQAAQLLFYPSAGALSARRQVSFVRTPTSLTWVVERLLPPERRAQIEAELRQLYESQRDQVARELLPILERSFRDASAVIEQELPQVIERHQSELNALGERYRRTLMRDEIVPLVKQEIWPLVRNEAEPELRSVGRELWQRLSLWRFGWRILYDATPLPDRQLTDKEWNRFVDQDAMPILNAHVPQFIEVVNSIVRELEKNPAVRQTLRRGVEQLLSDPELRRVAQAIFREAVVDNPRVRAALEQPWSEPATRHTLKQIGDRIEPALRRMGDMVFGTRSDGITDEFAAVLRLQILGKDKRWFVLYDADDAIAADVQPLRLRSKP